MRARLSASRLVLMAALSVLIFGCSPRSNWEEEVTIAPNEQVVVERVATFTSRGAVGSPAFSYPTRQSLRINLASGPTGNWTSEVDNRLVGKSTLKPIYLHRDGTGDLVLVTRFYYCENWALDFGRPKPPYVAYRWTGSKWERVPVPATFWGKSANLLIEPFKDTRGQLASSRIEELNDSAYEFDGSILNVTDERACRRF